MYVGMYFHSLVRNIIITDGAADGEKEKKKKVVLYE